MEAERSGCILAGGQRSVFTETLFTPIIYVVLRFQLFELEFENLATYPYSLNLHYLLHNLGIEKVHISPGFILQLRGKLEM